MLKLMVIGNVGKDAVVNTVNKQNVINFSVAHNENYTDNKGHKVEKTTWIDCSKWGENTSVSEYLTSGKQVFVEGIPSVDFFERENGAIETILRCKVISIQLLGSSKEKEDKPKENANNASNRRRSSKR